MRVDLRALIRTRSESRNNKKKTLANILKL